MLLRPYKVGGKIIIQNQEDIVSSIQLFYTVIRTFDTKTVIVPNGKLWNEINSKRRKQGKRRIAIELKFKYRSEFEKKSHHQHGYFFAQHSIESTGPAERCIKAGCRQLFCYDKHLYSGPQI